VCMVSDKPGVGMHVATTAQDFQFDVVLLNMHVHKLCTKPLIDRVVLYACYVYGSQYWFCPAIFVP